MFLSITTDEEKPLFRMKSLFWLSESLQVLRKSRQVETQPSAPVVSYMFDINNIEFCRALRRLHAEIGWSCDFLGSRVGLNPVLYCIGWPPFTNRVRLDHFQCPSLAQNLKLVTDNLKSIRRKPDWSMEKVRMSCRVFALTSVNLPVDGGAAQRRYLVEACTGSRSLGQSLKI